jgi:hypothetical protein
MLAFRIGDVARFPTPRSLGNYWCLTPACAISDQTKRIGAISSLARYLLGQLVLHVLRKDGRMRQWFQRIKKRRGAKIARVAVMRPLTVIFWHMLTENQAYDIASATPARARRAPVAGNV